MKRRKTLYISVPLALAALAAAVAIPLFGGTEVATKPAPATCEETLEVGTAAMRAYINPETGQLEVKRAVVPESELDAETREALRRDTEGLIPVYHADGSVSVNLQGRFQNATVLHKGENGLVTICTSQANCAQCMLDRKTAADKTPEVR